MTTKYSLVRDINGYNGFGLPISDTCYSVALGASSNTQLTVPSINSMGGGSDGQSDTPTILAVVKHSFSDDVWCAIGANAAAPGGSTFASTASILLSQFPEGILVQGGNVMNFYTTASNVVVSVAFYWLT